MSIFHTQKRSFRRKAFWQIYGVDLPEEVLKKIYQGNAARIIPGVREKL